MTATNHALTGAFIGLAVSQPVIALPLAFLSHFVLDAVPHWTPSGSERAWLKSRTFALLLVLEVSLCLLLVVTLEVTHPYHWLIAALCAFLAASPDLFWMKKYFTLKKTGRLKKTKNWFLRFHSRVQWFARPSGAIVELAWLVAMVSFLAILI